MYAKIKNNQLVQYPYTYADLKTDNPYTNFSGLGLLEDFQGTKTNLDGYSIELVVTQEHPQLDSQTQKAVLAEEPVLENAQWVLKWQTTNKTPEERDLETANKAAQVRSDRNSKLSKSDWTQLADAPVDKTAWATYREALRDVTQQVGFPWTINWPQQPE